MTKINDYLWHVPHTPLDDDPPDVSLLQQTFNLPISAALEEPLAERGYKLKSNDVAVRLDERVDGTYDTYYANVRFIRYLQSDIIARIHFEHTEWAHFLSDSSEHRYFINLDRFKVSDPATQIVVPAWSGRLHTRMSNRPEDVLHHEGEDQIWAFASAEELERQLQLILEKLTRLGWPWLENTSTF
jgi:hypothetical protein